MISFQSNTVTRQGEETTDSDIVSPHINNQLHNNNTVWNFAYGANMSSYVLNKRRGITPLQSIPCTLYNYQLNYTLRGIPYIEPAFGNVIYNNDSCVHGVGHELTADDFIRLMKSEAGGNETKHGVSSVYE